MSDRTPEEREHARLAREARREGRPPPPPPDPEPSPAPPAASGPPTPDPRAARPERRAARPAPGPPGAILSRPARAPLPVSGGSGGRGAQPPFSPPPGAGGDFGSGSSLGVSRFIPAVAGGIVAGIVVLILILVFQPGKGPGGAEVSVAIPEGAGVGEIGDLLEAEGIISHPLFFEVRATLGGDRGSLRSGDFRLREDMSYSAALTALTAAPVTPAARSREPVTVTIPEGRSRSEIAGIAADAGLSGDYEKATVDSKGLDPARYGGKGAADLEGFLFPATYELRSGDPVDDLVDQQLTAFRDNIAGVALKDAKKVNLTTYDVLTIASMVEREAVLDKERPIIASVIYNRLRDGIALGIDATIRFATGNWTEPLTESELAIDSPYNTRTNPGLPPGPIGNPGIASIEAAAKPAKTDFLYYVVKPDTCGEHAFSTTDADFQADVERYNSARAAEGGNSPTDCP